MGCGLSRADATQVRRCVRRCNTRVAVDLEPLVLSDPEAQRAVLDFQRADAAGDGEVLPADFARVFGLDDDLYLRRLVDLFDTTGSGSVCLAEFLVGVAHFAGSTSIPRDTLIRRFAFKLMDIDGNGVIPEHNLEQFVMVAYDEFAAKQRDPDNHWGDTVGVRSRAQADVKTCLAGIKRACPDGRLTLQAFEAIAADVPLLVAPAAFIWTTFENLGPACKFVCAAMNARGHKGFNAAVWGGRSNAHAPRGGGRAPAPPAASAGALLSAPLNAAGRRPPPRRPDGLVADHVAPENDDPAAQWARAAPARPARRDRVAPVPGPTAEDALQRMLAGSKGGASKAAPQAAPPGQAQRGRSPPYDARRQAPAPPPYEAGDLGDYGAYADDEAPPPPPYGSAPPPPPSSYGNAYGGPPGWQPPPPAQPHRGAQPPRPAYAGEYGAPPRWEASAVPTQSSRYGSSRSAYSPRPEHTDSSLLELYAITIQSPREQGKSRLAAANEAARAAPRIVERSSFDQQRGSFDQPGREWNPYPPQTAPTRGAAEAYW